MRRGSTVSRSVVRRCVVRRCVMGGSATAAHVAVRVASARRIVGETAVLVAFAALVLRMLVTAVRCAVTAEVAAVARAVSRTIAAAKSASIARLS